MAAETRGILLIVAGADRPGILDELSHFAADRGAGIGAIDTASLDGHFALVARLDAADADAAGRVRGDVGILADRTGARAWVVDATRAAPALRRFELAARGGSAADASGEADALRHAGNLLRVVGANIRDLSTKPRDLPHGDDRHGFDVRMKVDLPPEVPIGKFRELLGQLFDGLGATWELREL